MVELNLTLRAGDKARFDELFSKVRNDPNFASDAFVANAYRRLMDGDTRVALESARLALKDDPNNIAAKRLIKDLEIEYMKRIRSKLTQEKSQNAKLLNDKLNGHGEEGVAMFLVDALTTGVGESFQALAGWAEIYAEKGVKGLAEAGVDWAVDGKLPKGYYDFLEEVASLNADEAVREVAGIRLIESLRKQDIGFDELSTMTVPKLQEIIKRQPYNRDLTDEQAFQLRRRLFDGLNNLDVDAIREGAKTQYNIDVGKDYFDTSVLEPNKADFVAKQFSAWDTFLTFAPSARLGTLAKEVEGFRKLGMTTTSTLSDAFVKASRVESLGWRIYQNKSGAALMDGVLEFEGAVTMMRDAIKSRVGDLVYDGGSLAVSAWIDEATKPQKEALANVLRDVSNYYIGAEGTAAVEGLVLTLNEVSKFTGINATALRRGAHGVDKFGNLKGVLERERERQISVLGDPALATAAGRPSFTLFAEAAEQGSFRAELDDARTRLGQLGRNASAKRRVGLITKEADEVLVQMAEVADALRTGNRARARQLYSALQSGAGARLDERILAQGGKLAQIKDKLRLIESFKPPNPTDLSLVKTVFGKVVPVVEGGNKAEDFLATFVLEQGYKTVPK